MLGKVDVIIPFINPDQLLLNCIFSLKNNDNVGNFYLIQNDVDNVKVVEEKNKVIKLLEGVSNKDEVIHLIIDKKNTSIALNHGIRQSNERYVLFASSHSYFEDGYIDILHAEMEENKNIYAIGGRVVCLPASPDLTAMAVRDAFSSYFGSFSKYRCLKKQGKYFYSKKLYGTVYRKSALEKINLFDEEKERTQDIDVICRLIKFGGDTVIFPVKNVYWILTVSTPIDLYNRYLNQGYWTLKYNANNRNYFIAPAFILLFMFIVYFWGPLIKISTLVFFISIIVYSFNISKIKTNTLVVAISLFLTYAGYLTGIFKAMITVRRPDSRVS